MKTLLGLTAAVLLVVSLPGAGLAAEGDECTLGSVEYEFKRLPNPTRSTKPGTTVCPDDKTAYTPEIYIDIYQKQKRKKTCVQINGKAIWQFGAWQNDGIEEQEIGPASGGITMGCTEIKYV